MTGSRRASGRVSKGQNKARDEKHAKESTPTSKSARRDSAKQKPKKDPSADPEDLDDEDEKTGEDEEGVRCYCGDDDPAPEDEELRDMTQCTKCHYWQHIIHMGYTKAAIDKLPDGVYHCESCDPEHYDDLIKWLEAGKPPLTSQDIKRHALKKFAATLNTAARRRSSAINGHEDDEDFGSPSTPATGRSKGRRISKTPKQEDQPQQKAGKLSRGKRDALSAGHSNEIGDSFKKPKTGSTPARKPSLKTQTSASATNAGSVPQTPATPSLPAQIQLVSSASDLKDPTRQRVLPLLGNSIKKAKASGAMTSNGENGPEAGDKVALEIEHAVFMAYLDQSTGKTSSEYGAQLKRITMNLPRNPKLLTDLLSGESSYEKMARMTDEDMETEERKREKAAILEKNERQATALKDETLPVREKDTEMENGNVPAPGRSTLTGSHDQPKHEDDISEPLGVTSMLSPAAVDPGTPFAEDETMVDAGTPPAVAPVAAHPIDLDHQVSHVPESSYEQYHPHDTSTELGADTAESDYPRVWNGNIEFSAKLKADVAGFLLGKFGMHTDKSATDFLPHSRVINSRLDPEEAEKYVNGIITSNGTKRAVFVLAVRAVGCFQCGLGKCEECEKRGEDGTNQPSDQPEVQQSAKSFKDIVGYFRMKNRHGVVDMSDVPSVSECYFMPVAKDAAKLPHFLRHMPHPLPKDISDGSKTFGFLVFITQNLSDGASAKRPRDRQEKRHRRETSDKPALFVPSPPPSSVDNAPPTSAINDKQMPLAKPAEPIAASYVPAMMEARSPATPGSQAAIQSPSNIPHRVANSNHAAAAPAPGLPPPNNAAPMQPPPLSAPHHQPDPSTSIPRSLDVVYIPVPLPNGVMRSIPQFMVPHMLLPAFQQLLVTAGEIPFDMFVFIDRLLQTDPQAGQDINVLTEKLTRGSMA